MDEIIHKKYSLDLNEVTKKLGIHGVITSITTHRTRNEITGEITGDTEVVIDVRETNPLP